MKGRICFIMILVFRAISLFAEYEIPVPGDIRNNQYYLESLRLTKLAQESYEYGDYDASTEYAQDAIRYARLSDEYVALQLKIKEANDAIAAAKQRLDWADSSGAARQFLVEYGQARGFYDQSLDARTAEDWDGAIAAARRVTDILAYIKAPDDTKPLPPDNTVWPLPAQYTVRLWTTVKDCFWNIAGRPWVYNDPHQWRRLYNANRNKLPEPDNPDLIEPGIVLDIPGIRGEARQGMWDKDRVYVPLR